MKKKLLAMLMAVAVAATLTACGGGNNAETAETTETTDAAEETTDAAEAETTEDAAATDAADVSVILVTMDGLDNHWVNVDAGASAAAVLSAVSLLPQPASVPTAMTAAAAMASTF